MKMIRLVAAMAVAALLCACGPQTVASSGTVAPTAATAARIADKAALESTRALILAELSYEAAATAALKLIQAGVITGQAAAAVQRANRVCTTALIAAKATTTAAQRLAAVANLRSTITGLRNLIPGEAPDEVL